MLERVGHSTRGRYRQQRLERLYRNHHRLVARLRAQDYSWLEIEDAVEDAERERVLDLVGFDNPERVDDE